MLGDATAKQRTAKRWRSTAKPGHDDHERNKEGDNMAITDELMAWWLCKFPIMDKELNEDFTAIADRIDAEHAEAQRRWMAELDAAREQSFNAGFDDGFASADDWLAQHEDAMREHGWVKLPKDADGKVIRIGDKVTCGASVWEVTGFRLAGGGWGICCTIFFDQGGSGTNVYPPSELHHYRASTVEDVLEELLREYDRDDSELTNGEIIERFAAKLRLAESEQS